MRVETLDYLQKENLVRNFDFIKDSSCRGVKGVWKIESGKPGPTLGITLHTHGNEPSGLAILSYFREQSPLKKRLMNGTVIFTLNNILATKKFLAAKDDEGKRAARFIDVNMNRLPNDTMECPKDDPRYEVRRSQELKKVWEEFDVGIDIHSTPQKSTGMIVNNGKIHPQLIRGFPFRDILTNIENIQVGKPAMFFYGKTSIPVMVVESGFHESPQAFKRAISCVEALLKNLQMIEGRTKAVVRKYNEYFVGGSLIFPDRSYSLVKPFANYTELARGERIATNGKKDILAPFDGHSIFALPAGVAIKSLNEEVMFYLRPPKVITIK